MEYKRFGDDIVLRLDPGEEICASLLALAGKEDIRFAEINGLGAAREFTVGVLDPADKQFHKNRFEGAYEITSLHGTLSRKDGAPYLHMHMSAADRSGAVYGGHLNEAVIGVTAEIIVRCFDAQVERRMNDAVGIHQMIF